MNTGICCVFCYNRDRGHVTDLGASTLISEEFVQRIWESLMNVELVYTELFILNHKKNIVFSLAKFSGQDNQRLFGFNLPSFFFIEKFIEEIKELIQYADIIFANAAEAIFLSSLLRGGEVDELENLCSFLSKYPKINTFKKRVVVVTCGPDPAYISEFDFINNKETFYGKFTPEYVDENLIIDTNGAGDAFAGGFLSRYVKKMPLDECAKAGHYAAAVIIQTRGCQLPDQINEFSQEKTKNNLI